MADTNINRPWLVYLSLLRVPLLVFAVVVAFRWQAFQPGLSAYIAGMYDAKAGAIALTSAAGVLLWLALTTCTHTVLRSAALRFDVPPPSGRLTSTVFPFRWLQAIGATQIWRVIYWFAAVYAAGVLWLLSGYLVMQGATVLAPMALGILGSLAACGAGGWLVKTVFRNRHGKPGLYAVLMRAIGSPEGFFDEKGEPVPGHKFATWAFVISAALYGAAGAWGYYYNDYQLPTLLCVVLLMTNACWLFGGVAFFFDRWQFPLLLVLVLYAVGSAYWSADHVYQVERCADCAPKITAAQIAGNGNQPVVLVSTSGGGILAAAWTGTVLGRLAQDEPKFVPALKLISGVSGGSNGTMHFVNRLRNGQLNAETAFADPARSSLDAVAWGLAYPDFLRTLPGLGSLDFRIDRALAMQHAWTSHDASLRNATLSQWAAGEKNTPAVIFNATVAETGERFLFANYRVDPVGHEVGARRVFFEAVSGHDVAVTAAVAGSAAFPYVSPAARSSSGEAKQRFHLVDGGYYDNFGVASALDFLKDMVRQNPANTERPILMLMIEAGPESEYTEAGFQSEGWFYQVTAPPKGLIRMWQIAARARNFADLDWVKRHLKNVQTVRFVYRGRESPTSWHLTEDQQKMIRAQWPANQASADCVKTFLAGGTCPVVAVK